MKIAFCGFGRAGMEILGQLFILNGFRRSDLVVFTHEGEANACFLEFLDASGINYLTKSINQCSDVLDSFRPDYLISAYYRNIIKGEVLRRVDGRAMNLHPSLLPDYKGCFSGCWAIVNGEEETGISFHYMTESVDAGNILYQKHLRISPEMTAYDLYHMQVSAFVEAFPRAAGAFFSGAIGEPQDSEKGRYYSRDVPLSGEIDAEKTELDFAKRFVRAMYFPPFEPAKIRYKEEIVSIADIDLLDAYKHWFKK